MDEAGEKPTNTKEILNRVLRSVNQKRRRTIHQLSLIADAGGKCARCERTYHPFIYDFHHRDPRTKSYSLDRSVFGRKLSELRREAEKCVLLCANCHREVHTFLDTKYLVIADVNDPQPEVVYVPKAIGLDL